MKGRYWRTNVASIVVCSGGVVFYLLRSSEQVGTILAVFAAGFGWATAFRSLVEDEERRR